MPSCMVSVCVHACLLVSALCVCVCVMCVMCDGCDGQGEEEPLFVEEVEIDQVGAAQAYMFALAVSSEAWALPFVFPSLSAADAAHLAHIPPRSSNLCTASTTRRP